MHGVFCRDHPEVRLVRDGRSWRHADGRWCASSWPVYRSECRACGVNGNDIFDFADGVLTCRHCHTPVPLPPPVLVLDEMRAAPAVGDLPPQTRLVRTWSSWPGERR